MCPVCPAWVIWAGREAALTLTEAEKYHTELNQEH